MTQTYEWKEYPEQKPTASGYYYTYYKAQDGAEYYKAIGWNNDTQEWSTWRAAEYHAGIKPNVLAFVEESLNRYYVPCVISVQDNTDRYTDYKPK